MNWLLIALGAIPTLILSLAGHSLYMSWVVEPGQRHALEAQSKQLTEQCSKSIKEAEANNEEYETGSQGNNDDYDRVVGALGVCRHETIKLRSAAATSSVSQAYTAGKLVHADAADIGDLLAYGRLTEELRLRLISCKQDSDAIRAGNK